MVVVLRSHYCTAWSVLSRFCYFGFELLTTYSRLIASRLFVSVSVIYCRQLAGRPILLSSAPYIIVMLGLQDSPSRLHSHHATQQRHQYQPPHAPQINLQRRLDDARRRVMALACRPHPPPGPTPLSRVWSADEDMTDEAPSPQSSPCPPSRVNPGEEESLFERTSFKKPPPTSPKVDRDDDCLGRGRWGGQNRSAVRDSSPATKPLAFLEDDPQISKAETAWNSDKWAAAKGSTRAPSLFPDASVVAAKAADIPSSTPSPGLGRNDVDMEEYVPPPAVPPPTASWPTTTQTQQQPTNMGVKSENKPAPLNFSFDNTTKAPLNPVSLTAFQPLASAVWKTPSTASFVKPLRAPLPLSTTSTSISTLMAAWSPPDVQVTAPAPTSHPRLTFPISTSQHQQQGSQFRYTSPSQAMAPPHTVSPPLLQHLHIAPTAALNFSPPLPSPPLTATSSRPQLSSSIYLACLLKQEGNTGRDVKVMLKCKMMTCLQRDGVTFGRESLGNGMIDRYRNGFGCGGCGEMLEVVVC